MKLEIFYPTWNIVFIISYGDTLSQVTCTFLQDRAGKSFVAWSQGAVCISEMSSISRIIFMVISKEKSRLAIMSFLTPLPHNGP